MNKSHLTLFVFFCAALASLLASGESATLAASTERLQQHITELSKFGANPEGGVSRVAFSAADIAGRAVHQEIDAGCRARRAPGHGGQHHRPARGSDPKLPVIMTGSHIDSVPGGGNYDGDVGVLGAIEVAQVLQRARRPSAPSAGGREFHRRGRRADRKPRNDRPAGAEGTRRREPRAARRFVKGIRAVGGDPDRLEQARRKPGELKAFVELHIEQGAVLEEGNIDIGVVEGIVGIRWWDVTVEGVANHAGTTPDEPPTRRTVERG